MPAPQFHLTFGELVASHPGVHPEVRSAVEAEPVYAHLGSIFHDLPYYGNVVGETVRYAFRRPAIDQPWAYRMHCIRPDRFAAAYIRSARLTPGLNDRERLALVAGLLSHCALDLTLHPLVNYCARRDTALLGGHETFHHRITEKYHALFFHLERYGDDVLGHKSMLEKTRVVKQGHGRRSTAEPEIVAFMREAYRHAYGNAPAGDTWTRWVLNFRHFGVAVAGKLTRRNSLKVRENESFYTRYYRSDDFDFNAFYVHSERRVAELVNLAHAYFTAGDFSPEAEARFCEASRIDNLAEPDGAGLPTLPALPAHVAKKPLRLPLPPLPLPRLKKKTVLRNQSSARRDAEATDHRAA